ncbi:uncharacterized protein LOC119797367 [Cyprinodon tularosa]|uniref:uncharacterized protein LOC107102884 n=1 Tax=Cyprinodon variegatus TaxID=28743 RepID=UPI00074263E2|nr:PREDICTED: uncharacterized protein LOC107102884 [Cyprinodon variegatus]XP_038162350.1 uncharacterized protein LOC119797367 [Cyprinodon tularosa]
MSHKDPGDIHYFGQMPALSDCLYRYMYQSRYMAFQDPDELILPQSVDSWLKLLPVLEKRYGANKCYMFENNVFPRERSLPPPKPQVLPKQNQWQNVAGVNILAHLYKEPIMPQFKWAKFKIIVNPRAVFTITVHGVVKSQKGCAWIDRNIARMYHTRAEMQPKLRDDQLIYDGRLLSYSSPLIAAVETVLTETQLLPGDGTK